MPALLELYRSFEPFSEPAVLADDDNNGLHRALLAIALGEWNERSCAGLPKAGEGVVGKRRPPTWRAAEALRRAPRAVGAICIAEDSWQKGVVLVRDASYGNVEQD